jgi:hypothetical protein
MTVQETRDVTTTPLIPAPRAPESETAPSAATEREAPAPTGGEFPWPEPWHHSLGARPRSEFWDVASASWRSRGPVVTPRRTE